MLQCSGFENGVLEIAILVHEQALEAELWKRLREMTSGGYGDVEAGRNRLIVDLDAFDYDPIGHLEKPNWTLEF